MRDSYMSILSGSWSLCSSCKEEHDHCGLFLSRLLATWKDHVSCVYLLFSLRCSLARALTSCGLGFYRCLSLQTLPSGLLLVGKRYKGPSREVRLLREAFGSLLS